MPREAAKNVLVLNGPNLNLLGQREPELYGRQTLADIEADCIEVGLGLGLRVDCRQSNHEGELVDWVQDARGAFAGLVVNAGAYSHTSVALLDALKNFDGRVVEVHLTNIHRREEFRRHSYVSLAADAVICGFGGLGYRYALQYLAGLIADSPRPPGKGPAAGDADNQSVLA